MIADREGRCAPRKRRGIAGLTNIRSVRYPALLLMMLGGATVAPLAAQNGRIAFERISLDEGLSQSVVQAIHKDRKGFMWFGTESGLNKYDGYTFTEFKLNPFDSTSISNNTVTAIAEDRSGTLWVGTNGGGLNRFDREQNSFRRFVNRPGDPTSISNNGVPGVFCDRGDTVWVATFGGGIERLDRESGTFKHFVHDPYDKRTISSNFITVGCEDQAGRFWVGTNNGLNLYDRARDSFTRFSHDGDNVDSIDDDVILALYESPSQWGTLWIGTGNPNAAAARGGLNRLDVESGKITRYTPNAASDRRTLVSAITEGRDRTLWVGTNQGLQRFDRSTGTFTTYLMDPSRTPSRTNQVRSVTADIAGTLWVTSAANDGIYRFDPKTGTFLHCVHNPGNPASLSDNIVLGVFADTTGVVWIGTQTGGLSKIDLFANKFRTYASESGNPNSLSDNIVRSIAEGPDHSLWVGSARTGLNNFSPDRRRVIHYSNDPSDPSTLSSNAVWSLCVDRRGTLWAGTLGGGLNRFDRERGIFERYQADPADPRSLSNNLIRVIFEDRSGVLWVGTDGGGLNRFDPTTRAFKRYLAIPNDPTTISFNVVRTIGQDAEGALWIGTFGGGLNRFDPLRETFTRFLSVPGDTTTLSHNAIQSLYIDREGTIWIGTFGGGLDRFDPRSRTARHYTEQNSNLPNNVIYGVLGDDREGIWVSSNRGLARLDPRTGVFENFDISDGLQSKEFNGQACYRSPRGEMFFGGINGLNAFCPDSVRSNPYAPAIVITEFRIFDRPVRLGSGSPLSKDISETESITLPYWQNDLSFDFVALLFNRPQENRYAYMLENYDPAWRSGGVQRSATYTNLDPGEYVFRVRGSNSDGVWNNTGTRIRISIRPPWWKTGWATMLYVVIGLSLVLGSYRMQHARVTRKEREKAQIREAELRAQAAEAQARAIQAENERQTSELEEARKIQLSMLPREVPRVSGLDIAVYMQTATEVGGDYYDFALGEDGTLTVIVGDATGHGLKAGTMVSVIKGLFVSHSAHIEPLSFFATCTRTIRELHLGNLFMALTLIRIKDMHLTGSIAGMPPFYIYRKRTGIIEDVVLKGMPIGAFEDFAYRDIRLELEKGDTVLVLSDGLVELFNDRDEVFDYERVKDIFARIATESPQSVIDGLVQAGEQWRNGRALHDDVTFLVLKVKE